MQLYKVTCEECDLDAKIRLERAAAEWIGERHAEGTGHEIAVREVGASNRRRAPTESGTGD